ncbi:MAG: hypothetical protein ABWY82_26975 [Tardiphaga sp.]
MTKGLLLHQTGEGERFWPGGWAARHLFGVPPRAFADALRNGMQRVALLWGGHDENTCEVIGHTAAMWEDDYGLAFYANIDSSNLPRINSITRRVDPCDRASVSMLVNQEDNTRVALRTVGVEHLAPFHHVALATVFLDLWT